MQPPCSTFSGESCLSSMKSVSCLVVRDTAFRLQPLALKWSLHAVRATLRFVSPGRCLCNMICISVHTCGLSISLLNQRFKAIPHLKQMISSEQPLAGVGGGQTLAGFCVSKSRTEAGAACRPAPAVGESHPFLNDANLSSCVHGIVWE